MLLSLWSGEDGEEHRGHGIITIESIERQRKLEGNRQNIQQKKKKIQDSKTQVNVLKRERGDIISPFAIGAVRDGEEIWTRLMRRFIDEVLPHKATIRS